MSGDEVLNDDKWKMLQAKWKVHFVTKEMLHLSTNSMKHNHMHFMITLCVTIQMWTECHIIYNGIVI